MAGRTLRHLSRQRMVYSPFTAPENDRGDRVCRIMSLGFIFHGNAAVIGANTVTLLPVSKMALSATQ